MFERRVGDMSKKESLLRRFRLARFDDDGSVLVVLVLGSEP